MSVYDFQVFMGGDRLALQVSPESISFGPDSSAGEVKWDQVLELAHPNPASVSLTLEDGKRLQFAFVSRSERDRFSALANTAPGAGEQRARVVPASRAPEVALLTIGHVPGRQIVEVRGMVTSHAVFSRNVISDMGSDLKSVVGGNLKGMERAVADAMAAARRDLAAAARAAQADTVIGVGVAVAGFGDKAETVVLSGTAVRTSPVEQPVDAP